ncbi:Meiosis 1 arrest protein [Heracleum sosnowskyi]|uniref:Meiosis 1 arrest protein n=1 Tax=Heracleum sosnowskyi TaxID=360622 RepID=A0AAD8M3A8_9APIA|nr:Meiosis 1 arrest protein [Heracleum sosnowskyi]
MLCFVLDLRSLSPPLLGDIKQSLLQLANFYAISSSIGVRPHSKPLPNRFGLCYIINNRISSSSELKVAYIPRGDFSLRDFHHAVTSLPSDVFLPTYNSSGDASCQDLKLSGILSDNVLYSWKGDDKDITRKVILIGSNFVQKLDSVTKEALMDAAEKCVSVEFVLLDQKLSHLRDLPETINTFDNQISELENCSFRAFFPDGNVFRLLVKQWLQDLKDDTEEQLQAQFIFKRDLVGSLKQIHCSLCSFYSPMIDGFTPWQTCRCHGMPLDDRHEHKNKRSCPLTCNDLESPDIFDNSVKVGEQTVLFMPSFWCCLKLQQVSSPVDFKVIERTNLGSLSEGVIFGPSYVVTPSSCPESEDIDKSELNAQIFQGLCRVLHSLDQGLVCSSNCNIETLKQTSFQCYYILLPSDKGLMLLRRLAGSEEVVPTPDVHQLITSSSAQEIEDSVRTSILKIEARDYNPVLHERGFHQKLNALVKESLQFGSLPQKMKETSCESISSQQSSPKETGLSKQAADIAIMEEELPQSESKFEEDGNSEHVAKEWEQLLGNRSTNRSSVEETEQLKQANDTVPIKEVITQVSPKAGEDNATARIAEEWEQLIVNEIPKRHSPTCIAKPKFDQAVFSLPEIGSRHPDENTSRILERLEVPRQMRKNLGSPKVSRGVNTEECVLIKKPLIPFGSAHSADQGTVGSQSSQPMKPNFQRLKRKLR